MFILQNGIAYFVCQSSPNFGSFQNAPSTENLICVGYTVVGFWHAADMTPWKRLLILRCAIYNPLERLQISKMRLSEMGV